MKRKEIQLAKRNVGRLSLYRSVFSTVEGQRVLEDLMSVHYMMNSTFDGDTSKMLFREGERNVVLRILTILKTDVKAMQERIKSYEESLAE